MNCLTFNSNGKDYFSFVMYSATPSLILYDFWGQLLTLFPCVAWCWLMWSLIFVTTCSFILFHYLFEYKKRQYRYIIRRVGKQTVLLLLSLRRDKTFSSFTYLIKCSNVEIYKWTKSNSILYFIIRMYKLPALHSVGDIFLLKVKMRSCDILRQSCI